MHSVGWTAAGHPKGRSAAKEPRSGLTRRRPSDTLPTLHGNDRTIQEIPLPNARNSPGNPRSNNVRNNNASRQIGFGATVSRAFEGGLTVSVSPAVHLRRRDERHPLFAKQRLDRGLRVGVRALHRSLRYAGFAPYIGYSFEQTGSNIELYEYRNHGAVFGVTRSF